MLWLRHSRTLAAELWRTVDGHTKTLWSDAVGTDATKALLVSIEVFQRPTETM